MSEDSQRSRQRLRPWLEGHLNSGTVYGLYWLNAEKTKFIVPWYHQGRSHWTDERGQVFKEWAKQTGRFREGIDPERWVDWKSRLRCALNKATDIEEVKEESKESPDEEHPFRIFRFLSRQGSMAKKKPSSAAAVSSVGTSASSPIILLPEQFLLQQSPVSDMVPTVVRDFEDESYAEAPTPEANPLSVLDEIILSGSFGNINIGVNEGDFDLNKYLNPTTEPLPLQPPPVFDDRTMVFRLYYCINEVLQQTIEARNGLRVHYGDHVEVDKVPPNLLARMYGQHSDGPPASVWLPPCKDLMLDKRMEDQVQHVLEKGLVGGVYIRMQNGNILASRLCKCSIYYASFIGTQGNPVKLQRWNAESGSNTEEETVIFNFYGTFLPLLDQYKKDKQMEAPDIRVFILIGSEKKLTEINQTVPLLFTVYSEAAGKLLETAMAEKNQQLQQSNMSWESFKFNDVMEVPLTGEPADILSQLVADLEWGGIQPDQQTAVQSGGVVPLCVDNLTVADVCDPAALGDDQFQNLSASPNSDPLVWSLSQTRLTAANPEAFITQAELNELLFQTDN